jgi:outer membrane protein TolC
MLVKRTKLLILLLISTLPANNLLADSLDIYTCFKAAENLSPLKKQEALIQTDEELNQKNISTGYFPDISLSAKASYQSDVFSFPFRLPGFENPIIPKDQYQITLNLQQKIYDAGLTRDQHNLQQAKSLAAESQLKVDLNNIKNIVSQLYYSALIQQENLRTLNQSKRTLMSQERLMQSRIDNGALLPSALYSIQKELMNLDQQIIQSTYNRKSALELLSKWIGQDISDDTQLSVPALPDNTIPSINRPELSLFSSQQQVLQSSKAFSNAKQLPGLYFFAQGGYGQPNALNFLETKFTDYYMVGLQLSWKPFNWGSSGREKQSLQVQQDEIAARKEDFERNISMSMQQNNNEILKLQELMDRDDNIISLQQKIVDQYFSQMQNGVITPTDYLTEFNALTSAKINRQIHHILLSQTGINMMLTSGNIE